MNEQRYISALAAAYVRGFESRTHTLHLPRELMNVPLKLLSAQQLDYLANIGSVAELKMYRFKHKDDLPRVSAVLGFLRAVHPENLLDVGSGRGAFLFPLLRDFPTLEVTSLDILPDRVGFLADITAGGIDNLRGACDDIVSLDMPDGSFDIITLLEVLEHIPDVAGALKNAVRLARRYVVVTVPSKPDDNPEHIHLLTKEKLTELFHACGVENLKFGGVTGHTLCVAHI